jgi:hypothetical protein
MPESPSRRRVTDKRSRGRQPSFLRFLLKASAPIIGLAVLMVLGYIGLRMLSRSEPAPNEAGTRGSAPAVPPSIAAFTQQVIAIEQRVVRLLNNVEKDDGEDVPKTVSTALSDLRKVNPPEDGRALYDALAAILECYDRLYNREYTRVIALPEDQQEKAWADANSKVEPEVRRLHGAYTEARRAFRLKHFFNK